METKRRSACVLIIAGLLPCLQVVAAEPDPQSDPHKEWVTFCEELNKQAGAPTGMYAIQDVQQLQAGENAYLLSANRVEDVRWARQSNADALAAVEYRDKRAIIRGKGIAETDLIQAKDRPLKLPNGLIVGATLFKGTDAKLWLFNPQLTKQRNFKGLDFFPYSPDGVVTGHFVKHAAPTAITYLDSREEQGTMYVMGTLHMKIDGKPQELKMMSYKKDWNEIEWLLMLLKDRTSGKTTYGGGRVVEVRFPKGQPPESMTVNLNTAYSFLCAHSNFYNCPLALTNNVDAELNFGEKYPPL